MQMVVKVNKHVVERAAVPEDAYPIGKEIPALSKRPPAKILCRLISFYYKMEVGHAD